MICCCHLLCKVGFFCCCSFLHMLIHLFDVAAFRRLCVVPLLRPNPPCWQERWCVLAVACTGAACFFFCYCSKPFAELNGCFHYLTISKAVSPYLNRWLPLNWTTQLALSQQPCWSSTEPSVSSTNAWWSQCEAGDWIIAQLRHLAGLLGNWYQPGGCCRSSNTRGGQDLIHLFPVGLSNMDVLPHF